MDFGDMFGEYIRDVAAEHLHYIVFPLNWPYPAAAKIPSCMPLIKPNTDIFDALTRVWKLFHLHLFVSVLRHHIQWDNKNCAAKLTLSMIGVQRRLVNSLTTELFRWGMFRVLFNNDMSQYEQLCPEDLDDKRVLSARQKDNSPRLWKYIAMAELLVIATMFLVVLHLSNRCKRPFCKSPVSCTMRIADRRPCLYQSSCSSGNQVRSTCFPQWTGRRPFPIPRCTLNLSWCSLGWPIHRWGRFSG